MKAPDRRANIMDYRWIWNNNESEKPSSIHKILTEL